MKIKVADLIGPAMDWAIATCEGYECQFEDEVSGPWLVPQEGFLHDEKSLSQYSPSTNWTQGGPLLERERLDVRVFAEHGALDGGPYWISERHPAVGHGPTPLVAAMRCLITATLGDEVDVPDELV